MQKKEFKEPDPQDRLDDDGAPPIPLEKEEEQDE